MIRHSLALSSLFAAAICLPIGAQIPHSTNAPANILGAQMDRSRMPEPVFEKEPGFVELYWRAWGLAYAHRLAQPGLPQSPYMDEAFWDDTIWIWDTCFMTLFCRYAPDQFPGIETLNNFYVPLHDGRQIPLTIQHPDNPPLFAWAEYDYFQLTGDIGHLRSLLEQHQYLQKHYHWFEKLTRGNKVAGARIPVALRPQPLGFQWNGVASGMDNSPRFDRKDPLAIDAIAQQGLSARYIMLLAARVGNKSLADEYRGEFDRLKKTVNEHYWDETDGFYYDLLPDGKTFSKVRTPASFWPVLAGMASTQQVARMTAYVRASNELGGVVPWVSVSRSDPSFNPAGGYWRGAVWLPMAYMGIRSLAENAYIDLANTTAEAVLRHMLNTYRSYEPHTIWECYNPLKPEPATTGNGERVRPDFCGWSALGPISLFIENVIGLYRIDATEQVVEWRLHQSGRHGIRRLRFGKIETDLIADGNGHVDVTSNHPFTLRVNGRSFSVKTGKQRFEAAAIPLTP